MPFTFENRVGRLIEACLVGSLTAEETQQFRTRMFLTLSGLPGRAVMIGDLRRCELFSAGVGEKMVSMLKLDNPKVERTAFLVREGPLALQVERIIADAAREARQAGKAAPPRQALRDARAACAWLGEVLTDVERARLAEMLPE